MQTKGSRECIEEKVRALAHSRQNFVGSRLSHSAGGECGGTRGHRDFEIISLLNDPPLSNGQRDSWWPFISMEKFSF